jgi:hypothetical protein
MVDHQSSIVNSSLPRVSVLHGIDKLLNFRPLFVNFGQMLLVELLVELEFLVRQILIPHVSVAISSPPSGYAERLYAW